jgi:hypothetical protein
LSGTIPAQLANLQNLQVLRLGENSFTAGPIPNFIYPMLSLVDLRLNNCQRNGQISPAISLLVNLETLALQGNDLVGEIPDLSDLVAMESLRLDQNAFSGTYPDISVMPNLRVINLSENAGLSGNMPDFATFTTGIERIEMRECGLFGTIDPAITSITTLGTFTKCLKCELNGVPYYNRNSFGT